ncbi:LADA_0C01332g1_1 [Lachancea dasiensis]|uniref:LADA_0C01332g1_1 n=1 Tax=Lachancea dasiensis TaxID=1072105 RepID=A0A1G4IXF8_9SACH|nr:LADA_0C01332g1_1 [Lachancea dasiensis]
MSTILYNANSSLVPRFQRKVKLKNDPIAAQVGGASFESSHAKNSPEYLRELAQSVYPDPLRSRITQMDYHRLTVHAFFALVFKNFVSSWFGPKIPSTNQDFLTDLFSAVDQLIDHFENHSFDWERLVLDDIPFVIIRHFQVFKEGSNSFARDPAFLNASSFICSLANSESKLEATLLKSLYENLICGKILNSIANPDLVLEVLNKLLTSVNQRSQSSPVNVKRKTGDLKLMFSSLFQGQSPRQLQRPFAYRYLFTCLKKMTSFERRRPLLYCICKYGQQIAIKLPVVDRIMYRLFRENIVDRVSTRSRASLIFNKLRQLVFPTDICMGPPRVALNEAQRQALRLECQQNLHKLVSQYRIDLFLGLTDKDLHDFVALLSMDQRSNRDLMQRILTCVVAHSC